MAEASVLAAVDLGSNSFRMEVGRVVGSQIYTLDSFRESVRLASGLTKEKLLGREAFQRGLAVLDRFGERLRGFDRHDVRAVATNTLRVARNAKDFLREAERRLGFPIEVIAGREEARLIYFGVAHLQEPGAARRLVVDIGGGSTELVIGTGREMTFHVSNQAGVVRQTERFLGSDPPARDELEALASDVREILQAGVPEERWVFPLSGADANDHWFISQRAELHRSPAIRLAGAAALDLAGLGIDDVGAVDLYSCFPIVVQMAATELGLAVDDPARPLTLTGGLTFGGGPGNNYTSHGIARAVGALRDAPATAALVSGLGWYATKHAIGVYASRPPDHEGRRPFAWRDLQPEVDALPQCRVDPDATGAVRVETYTVTFDRDGTPERGILACRTPEGTRAWGNLTDADTLASLCAEEGIGRTGTLAADGALTLDG